MIIRPKTNHTRDAGAGRLMRATLISAGLALVASPFVMPASARADLNQQFYQFCITNLGQGNDYCCAHAGGNVKGSSCLDPATGNVISPAAVRQG
ncbi:hypothetical protein [Mycobacterium terramassiliense]|uniref:Uncharacterized protein n=1 Tax=Mycobacterium terramassiliense TaxID=1841859 RepID=A0A2U3N9U5_9MYCO|nr:hypothetical protein [Mycobacterium terramassiliense]SPM28263.1 hypothetical protein MycrhN_5001 [Mycobacterium terramassiliense]